MPSILIGQISGGVNLISGAYLWSGIYSPFSFLALKWDPNASGSAYIALSGGVTIASGGFALSGMSGLGIFDGIPLARGNSIEIPKHLLGASGNPQVYVTCDAAASGQARMYFEPDVRLVL